MFKLCSGLHTCFHTSNLLLLTHIPRPTSPSSCFSCPQSSHEQQVTGTPVFLLCSVFEALYIDNICFTVWVFFFFLKEVAKIGEGLLDKPEDVCFDGECILYTATRDGWIKRLHRNGSWEDWRLIGGDTLLGVTTTRTGGIVVCDTQKVRLACKLVISQKYWPFLSENKVGLGLGPSPTFMSCSVLSVLTPDN